MDAEKAWLRLVVVLTLLYALFHLLFVRKEDLDVMTVATKQNSQVQVSNVPPSNRKHGEHHSVSRDAFLKNKTSGQQLADDKHLRSLPVQVVVESYEKEDTSQSKEPKTQAKEEKQSDEEEPVVHVFVINLNSNVDRHFVAQNRILDQPGFAFHHIPAVDARANKDGCGGPMETGGNPNFIDLECVTQSHIKALVMGAEYLIDNDDFIVVMEDDVSFGLRPFWRHQSLRQMAAGWSETHCDWSLVLLAPWLQDEHWAGMYYHYLTESTNWQMLRKHRGDLFWGAAAYAINTKGIREAFHFLELKPSSFPIKYDFDSMAAVPSFSLHASQSHFYCGVPRHGGILKDGKNATVLSDCLIFDIVEAPYLSLPPLFVWDSSAIYSSTLHKDHEDAQGQGREKILEFAMAVRDLDKYHHRICSVISGFGSSGSGCMHALHTGVVGATDAAKPLLSLELEDAKIVSLLRNSTGSAQYPSEKEINEAKILFCCHQCEHYLTAKFSEKEQPYKMDNEEGYQRRILKTPAKVHEKASKFARNKFFHLDDNKCSLWHIDSDMRHCNLWNGQHGLPRSMDGHLTGIPEGQCPTQESNTAVTPRQVCRSGGFRAATDPLPPTFFVPKKKALQNFESGHRPVVSTLKFPQALLSPTPKTRSTANLFADFHSSAICVSRVDQSVSGWRNQTVVPSVKSVDDCCFACESEARCKAWTFDTSKQICYIFNRTALSRSAFYQNAKGFVGGLVTDRFCDMSPEALAQPDSFVLPNTDIKGWDIILPGLDQGFFAYTARHCCVLVAAMDEYRLHGWTFDGSWHRCYPEVSRVGGTNLAEPGRELTSGILLQGVPKCLDNKCIVPNHEISNTLGPRYINDAVEGGSLIGKLEAEIQASRERRKEENKQKPGYRRRLGVRLLSPANKQSEEMENNTFKVYEVKTDSVKTDVEVDITGKKRTQATKVSNVSKNTAHSRFTLQTSQQFRESSTVIQVGKDDSDGWRRLELSSGESNGHTVKSRDLLGGIAFCDGTLDPATGNCIDSRKRQRGYDCRDCLHCHDACQGFLADRNGGYAFSKDGVCQDYLSEWGYCGTSPEHVNNGLDCRGCRIREELYNGKCSHLCQYPERCSTWFSSDFKCVPKFVYGFIIADCNSCDWSKDDKGLSVE
jgi:GR25 family glycosyltransferase involved in LPS biosynthesis